MNRDLVVYIQGVDLFPCAWALFEVDSTRLVEHGTASLPGDFQKLADSKSRVSVLVPGEFTVFRRIDVRARSDAQIRAIIPYALEDELGSDPEDMHVAFGLQKEDESRAVCLVDQGLMKSWTDQLETAGLRVTTFLPDFLACRDEVTLAGGVQIGTRTLFWNGTDLGFACETPLATLVLQEFVKRGDLTPDYKKGSAKMSALDLMERYVRNPSGLPVNLAQGPYAAQYDWKPVLALWWRSAAVVALALVAAFGSIMLDVTRLGKMRTELETETLALYRATFPDERRFINLGVQMQQHLLETGATGQDDLMVAAALLMESVHAVDGVRIESFRYNMEKPGIAATIIYGSYEEVDRFRSAAEALGAQVEEGSARKEGDLILGDVVLKVDR